MQTVFQQTIKNSIEFRGIGLHTGKTVKMTLKPAMEDQGILFQRKDIGSGENIIRADAFSVTETQLATTLANKMGASIMTTEHLLSALYGLRVDNVFVEVEGVEIPAMDGSSQPYVEEIQKTGLRRQSAQRRYIRVLKPFLFKEGEKQAGFFPSETLSVEVSIEFENRMIGQQDFTLEVTPENYCQEIAPARTFALKKDVEALQKAGFALGGSLKNAIVVDVDKILNPDGLRFKDEFVRHKTLDVLGDISLMRAQLKGLFKARETGHGLNNKALRAFLSDKTAWCWS